MLKEVELNPAREFLNNIFKITLILVFLSPVWMFVLLDNNPDSAEGVNKKLYRTTITSEEYGDDWPFSISAGRLDCDGPGTNVILRSGGHVYALNGHARGSLEENGYIDYRDAIAVKDKHGYYAGNISVVISRGLELCK